MTKQIEEWERDKGLVLLGDVNPTDELTESAFLEQADQGSCGVQHDDRIAFLKANGYEITRANLIDSSLSTVQPQEAK